MNDEKAPSGFSETGSIDRTYSDLFTPASPSLGFFTPIYPGLLPSRAPFSDHTQHLLGLPPLYPSRQSSVISPVDLSICTIHHQCVGPCVVALLCRSNRLGDDDDDDDDAKWLSLVSLTVLLLWPRLVLTLRISPITRSTRSPSVFRVSLSKLTALRRKINGPYMRNSRRQSFFDRACTLAFVPFFFDGVRPHRPTRHHD